VDNRRRGGNHEDVPSWSTFTGQSEEEFKGQGGGRPFILMTGNGWRHSRNKLWKRVSPTRRSIGSAGRTGSIVNFAVRAAPVIQIDDAIGEWIVSATDISERKKLDESLRASGGTLCGFDRCKESIGRNPAG